MQNDKRKGKWMPFDSLDGHRRSLRDAEKELEKEPFPILSDDEIDELNFIINQALIEKTKVRIEFFSDGKRILKEGYIKKVDTSNNVLLLDNYKITLSLIVNIKMV